MKSIAASRGVLDKMGKEFRAGLYVVGALLLAFCTLLYARLSRVPAGGLTEVSIESPEQRTALTPTNRRVPGRPTIVRNGPDNDPHGSGSSPHGHLGNPRESQQPDESERPDWEDRERRFLPIAPVPLSEEFVSTARSEPDAIAPDPTMSVTVQPDEDLHDLAQRLYGSVEYSRALWQWLFEREQVEMVAPRASLQLPTRATLRREYPQLVPSE